MPQPDEATLTADGRGARRDRNRLAVLDAVIGLFTEGTFDPVPEEVARRAGLSVRSVYRYFEDRDALVRAAIDRQLEGVLPLSVIHAIGEGPLDDRIERFVTTRLGLYDAMAAVARAARIRAASNDLIRAQVEATRRGLGEQVDRHFAPELAALPPDRRRARSVLVDTLFQPESLDHYRLHRELSPADTHSLLVEALHLLLDGK